MQKARLTAAEADSEDGRPTMANSKQPITIKKYANRRLYNTGTSAYVTLEDLAGMVKKGEDFVVFDAKSGEDITRSVLTQIIFEQEGKGGQSLLPIAFLRQLIRFYGDSMQMLVPSYLEFSIDKLTSEQQQVPRPGGGRLRLAGDRAVLRLPRGAGAQEHGAVQSGAGDVQPLRRAARAARRDAGESGAGINDEERHRGNEASARRFAEANRANDAEGVRLRSG